MITIVSNINNHNLYPEQTLRKKKTQYGEQVNFQGKTTIFKTLPLTISALPFFASINNNTDFEDYFTKISKIPKTIYLNRRFVQNPEVDIYIEKLDNLNNKEKKQFVKTFCEKTGFPKLEVVRENIDNEIKRAVEICFKDSDAKPLFVGYATCCSVGRNTALPGSDCDGLFIISDRTFGKNIPQRWNIGNEINQRLLETQGAHYPELFSIEELLPYIKMADEIFEKIKTPEKIENYKHNLTRDDNDFVKAGEFNLDIAEKITDNYDKDMMYLTSFFVELIRSGHILINNIDKDLLCEIENSALYKYSNVVRQEGFRNSVKAKWTNRIKMASEFDSKSDDEKFEICKTILKASMENYQQTKSNLYENCDMGNVKELIAKLTSWGSV